MENYPLTLRAVRASAVSMGTLGSDFFFFKDPIYLQAVIKHSANGGKYGVRKPCETAGKGNLQTRITSTTMG
jgi:hypothetical protein